MVAVIGPSLSRLDEAPPMTRYLFETDIAFDEDATQHLQQDGVAIALQEVLSLSESAELNTVDDAKALIQQVVKGKGLKKGLVMKTLRAALTGALKGPDLIQSWLLLHQRQQDQPRLKKALAIAQ
jgi:glutamyl-tRNA synthetase